MDLGKQKLKQRKGNCMKEKERDSKVMIKKNILPSYYFTDVWLDMPRSDLADESKLEVMKKKVIKSLWQCAKLNKALWPIEILGRRRKGIEGLGFKWCSNHHQLESSLLPYSSHYGQKLQSVCLSALQTLASQRDSYHSQGQGDRRGE